MVRKSAAISLIAFWVVLSAIDLLEDLDLAAYPKVHSAQGSASPDFGRSTKVANNAVENGSRRIGGVEVSLIAPPARSSIGFELYDREINASKNNRKIYKLHSVFLI